MFYLSSIAAFITTAQGLMLPKAKSYCSPKVLQEAMKQLNELSASMGASTKEGIMRFMIKSAEAREVISNCLGMPALPQEALTKKLLPAASPEDIQAMASKVFGGTWKLAHAPIHISEARDFVVDQAAKVSTTAAKVVATTTVEVAKEQVERTFTDLLGETAGFFFACAALGLGAYAIYQLYFASKQKSN